MKCCEMPPSNIRNKRTSQMKTWNPLELPVDILCPTEEDDCLQTWADALPDEAQEKVKDFYVRPDVSVHLSDAKMVKIGEGANEMIKAINQEFTTEKPKARAS